MLWYSVISRRRSSLVGVLMKPMFCALLLATASFFAIAAPQTSRKPLSKAELLDLVTRAVPKVAIAEVVQRDGIAFEPSEEVLNEFRKAGADDGVIAALRASWHPECPVPLSDKDILVLAEHMPSEKTVNMVRRCGIRFQPSDEYLQGLLSSGAKGELIEALRTSAKRPFSRSYLFRLLAAGEDAGQMGKGVQERGIDFDPTEEDLAKLHGAGAPESLFQAIRDAKRIKPPVNPSPNASESMPSSPTGLNGAHALKTARVICSSSTSSVPVFASPTNLHTIVGHLQCGDRVAILEKDAGRMGIDKILLASGREGFVQDTDLGGPATSANLNVSPPVPTYQPQPAYTPQARRDQIEGTVEVWITIDSQGSVVEAQEMSKPLGDGLDEKAIETVKTWKFKPATLEGVPVPVRVRVMVVFRLLRR